MTMSTFLPSDYEGDLKLPLVPQVEYPHDHETDDQLYRVDAAAVRSGDQRAQAEARLDLAHRSMVYRDAVLARLVKDVQNGDRNGVLHSAPIYAYWHGAMERDLDAAANIVRGLPEREAER